MDPSSLSGGSTVRGAHNVAFVHHDSPVGPATSVFPKGYQRSPEECWSLEGEEEATSTATTRTTSSTSNTPAVVLLDSRRGNEGPPSSSSVSLTSSTGNSNNTNRRSSYSSYSRSQRRTSREEQLLERQQGQGIMQQQHFVRPERRACPPAYHPQQRSCSSMGIRTRQYQQQQQLHRTRHAQGEPRQNPSFERPGRPAQGTYRPRRYYQDDDDDDDESYSSSLGGSDEYDASSSDNSTSSSDYFRTRRNDYYYSQSRRHPGTTTRRSSRSTTIKKEQEETWEYHDDTSFRYSRRSKGATRDHQLSSSFAQHRHEHSKQSSYSKPSAAPLPRSKKNPYKKTPSTSANHDTSTTMSRKTTMTKETTASCPRPHPHTPTVLVEISPGVRVELRGAAETRACIQRNFYTPSTCFSCNLDMFAIQDAAYVLCPQCRVVNPSGGDIHLNPSQREYNHECSRYGLGLGFTHRELEDIMLDIRREQQCHQKGHQSGGRLLSDPRNSERQYYPQHYRTSRVEIRSGRDFNN